MGLTKNLGWLSKYITTDSNGQVGIGCVPVEKFHVNSGTGNVPALFESTDPIAVAQFKDNNSTGFSAVGTQTNDLIFYSNNNINMRLDAVGNLGIGINPDNGKLTILKNTSNATESSYGIALQSNATNAYTELLLGADDTVDCGVIQTAGKNTSFSTKKLSLQPRGGSVLIGSTSNLGPKLQIEGADDIVQIRSTDAASRSTLVFSTSGYDWEVGARGSANNPANAFYIYNNDTSSYRFIISQSGNVLIGKQSDDGQKLQVNGGIKSTQNSTNNCLLMKKTTVGANSTTNVFFNINTELGVPSAGYVMIEISSIGYGNAGSNGMNFMGIVGGYSGHTINGSYHRATTYVNTITNGSVSMYNPSNDVYGITITNSAGSGMELLLKLDVTWLG